MATQKDWVGVWAEAGFFKPPTVGIILIFFVPPETKFDEQLKEKIDALNGYYISGEQSTKEDHHGIWLSHRTDKGTVDLMIPWRFVHVVVTGSQEQVKKFGFPEVSG